MKQVILFGGRSFLGGHICRALVSRGYKVILQSSTTTDFKNLKDLLPHPNVKPIICSLNNYEDLHKILAKCQGLIYAAIPYFVQSLGSISTSRSTLGRLETFLQFLKTTRIDRQVFVSVCGTTGVTNPRGWLHQRQKVEAERLVQSYSPNAVIVKPTMCVGPFDTKPSTGEFFRFINWLPFSFMKDNPINLVAVEDAALGTVLALERGRPGQRYILGSLNTTMGELIKSIKGYLPSINIPDWLLFPTAYFFEALNLVTLRPKPIVPLVGLEMIKYGLQHYNSEKAKQDFGFNPGTPDIRRAVTWYKENGII